MTSRPRAAVVPEDAPGQRVVLRTRGLTKRFGRILAVQDLNLELHAGEVFGFLGPNGSGKSTTVGMLLGLVRPTAGEVEAFGLDLRRHSWSIRRRMGAVMEQPAFYPYLSGRDNLRVIARALGEVEPGRIEAVLGTVGLTERADDRYSRYSLGMKQRLGIAAALLRDPDLVILDEPTNGLDPAGTKEVRELIPRLAAEGRTVFLCSHLLYEVEQVCQRVAIVKEGRVLAQGPVALLLQRGEAIELRVDDVEGALAVLGELPWVSWAERQDSYIVVGVPAGEAAHVNAVLAQHGIYLSELRPRQMSLESFFLELTEEG
ncbi:MAG: ABC transporter ATP-binding protein [Dehalococcoidia bacterium]